MKIKNAIITFIYCFGIMLILCNCGQKNSKTTQTQESPPETLIQLEQNIDSIIDILDKEGKVSETSQPSSTSSQQGQGSSGQSSGQGGGTSQDQSTTGSSQGGSQSSQPQQSGQTQSSVWDQADTIIKQIHKKWNDFQPIATKAGVSPDITNAFDNDLNTLTNCIAGKNLMSTLDNANNLYKYIPEFYSHYKSKTVDIKRLKFYVRDVMYKSRFDKWDLADLSVSKMSPLIPNIRSQSKEEIKSTFDSLIFGVTDLEKVTRERQKSLVQIKGNIILEKIKSTEKYLEKQAQNEEKEKKK